MPNPYHASDNLSGTTFAASVVEPQPTQAPDLSTSPLNPSNISVSPLNHNRRAPATSSRHTLPTAASNFLDRFDKTQGTLGKIVNNLGDQIQALETPQSACLIGPTRSFQRSLPDNPVLGLDGRPRARLSDRSWNGALDVISGCKATKNATVSAFNHVKKRFAKKVVTETQTHGQKRTDTATAQGTGGQVGSLEVDVGQSSHNHGESPSAKLVANSSK